MTYKLIEEVKAKAGELVIPYSKFEFENGLTVIIHQDHSNPLVHVDVTYHVGSGREEVGKSGFAHFFEHMMFEGSKHVANNEHFKFISEAGGTLNGTTNRDRTNYFETLPNNELELALWLESDRMGYLLEAMTEESFNNQLSVIKNEKAQRYENQPYGMMSEITQENLYPINHPYSWTTIGYTEDLDRVSTKDMMAFFKRWYGPNNATLTIGGDVEIEATLALVEQYFGSIPRGPQVDKPVYPPLEIAQTRYVSFQDKVRFPMLQITFPTVPVFHEDEAALDILSDILGSGKNGLLYEPFVKSQKAVQVYASNICYEGAGELRIGVFAYPNQHLGQIEKEIHELLDKIHSDGISQEGLERVRVRYYSQALYHLESVKDKVSRLASYQLFAPELNYIQQDVERYKHIDAEQVMAVFNKYIYKKHALNVTFYDEPHKELIPREDNWNFERQGLEHIDLATEAISTLNIKENLNRFIKPKSGPSPIISIPNTYELNFDNGLKIMGAENYSSPTVSILLTFNGGSITDAEGQSGRSAILARMMRESSKYHSAEEISAKLELLGSSISASNSKEKFSFSISSLTENLGATMLLFEEILFHPAFKEDELARVAKEQKEMLAYQESQPDIMANRAFYKSIYGESHPMGQPASGRIKDIENISVDSLKSLYKQIIAPNNAKCVLSGAVSKEEWQQLSGFLANWEKQEVKAVEISEPNFMDAGKVLIAHKEGAAQSEIRIGYPSLAYDATGDYYKSGIMNYPLGSAFNSRINLNLREDKGYTYGARSYFSGATYPGPFIAAAAVSTEVTAAAVKEFMYEIQTFHQKGITEEELEFTKKSLLNKEALRYETNGQRNQFLFKMLEFGLVKETLAQQKEILANIASSEVNRLAEKYLPFTKMVIVVAGDREKISAELEALNIGEVIQLDGTTEKV